MSNGQSEIQNIKLSLTGLAYLYQYMLELDLLRRPELRQLRISASEMNGTKAVQRVLYIQ